MMKMMKMPNGFSAVESARLESTLARRLSQPLPGAVAQRRFAPNPARKGWEPDQQPADARRAAALVLIYPGEAGPSVALTVRHDDVPHHPGQISLPGGGIKLEEQPIDAALREAEEEIGVPPADVRIVGALSPLWVIVSGFIVFPFVGIADARPDFRLAAREVARLLEAPVSRICESCTREIGDAHSGWIDRPIPILRSPGTRSGARPP